MIANAKLPVSPCIRPDDFNVKLKTIFVDQNNNSLIVRHSLWILVVVHSLRSLRVLPVVVGIVWGRGAGGGGQSLGLFAKRPNINNNNNNIGTSGYCMNLYD